MKIPSRIEVYVGQEKQKKTGARHSYRNGAQRAHAVHANGMKRINGRPAGEKRNRPFPAVIQRGDRDE